MLLHDAVSTRLGEVVRFFSLAPPWQADGDVMRVCLEARELAGVPEGSSVLLRVRAEDVAYLNVIRPLFAKRRLRAVLWADEDGLEALLRDAVDLVDWVFRTVAVPPRRWPAFAEHGVAAALGAEVPWVWDGEREQLEALLGDVGWADGIADLRASMSFREMLRRLEGAPGLVVVEGIGRELDAWRVRMALARAGRGPAWVAVRPSVSVMGSWRLHARQADWEVATARLRDAGWEHAGPMAAWVDLEPERIDEAVTRVGCAPVDPATWDSVRVAVAAGPAHVLRARVGDEDVQTARARLGGHGLGVPEDPAARVVWSEGAEEWSDDAEGAIEARLVRCLRSLGDATPSHECLAAAAEIELPDVAAELGRIRFDHGADARADGVVEWLERHGEVEDALRIARVWQARARALDDRRSLESALGRLGDLQRSLGNAEQARHHYEEGLAIARGLAEREPGRWDLQRDLSLSLHRLGDLHQALGEGEQARRCYEEGLGIGRALVEREPGVSFHQRDLSVSYERLGDLHVALGNAEHARRCYEEGSTIRRMQAEREPGRSELQRDLSVSCERLGDLHAAVGDAEQARRCYEEGLAIRRTLAEREPANIRVQGDLAILYERMATVDTTDAPRWLAQAIALHRQRRAIDPSNAITQRELAVALYQLGRAMTAQGDPQAAVEPLAEAYALLGPLRDRGALEARYLPLVERLATLVNPR